MQITSIAFGSFSGGETPVPIPTTEVKPTSADGSQDFITLARVGHCRFMLKPPLKGGFFVSVVVVFLPLPRGG